MSENILEHILQFTEKHGWADPEPQIKPMPEFEQLVNEVLEAG